MHVLLVLDCSELSGLKAKGSWDGMGWGRWEILWIINGYETLVREKKEGVKEERKP